MAREIKERDKFESMSEEEKGEMENAISKEFLANVDELDEVDYLFFMYFTQHDYMDRIAFKLQLFKCKLFYSKL